MIQITDAQLESSLEEHIISHTRDQNNYDSICFEGLTRTESGIAVLTELIKARKEIERQRALIEEGLDYMAFIPTSSINAIGVKKALAWIDKAQKQIGACDV